MKRILLLVLLLMVFMTTCTSASKGKVYEDKWHTFRATFPEEWQINKIYGAVFAATAANHSTLKIYIDVANRKDPFSSKEEEEKFAAALIKETNTVKDNYHILVDNQDAIRIISVDDKNSMYSIQYTFNKNGVIFVVTGDGDLSQLDEDQEIFDQIMSTFKIIG